MNSDHTDNSRMREEFIAEFAARIGMSVERTGEILDAILTLLTECANGQCSAQFLETLPFEIVSSDS